MAIVKCTAVTPPINMSGLPSLRIPEIQYNPRQLEDSLLRRVGCGVAAAVCFCASIVALCWSWADLTVRSTRAPDRPSDISKMTTDRWQTAVRRIQQARAINPFDANYAAELGRHHAWLAWQSQGLAGVSAGHRNISSNGYRQAIRLRPIWGFAWANYAEANLLAGKGNSETGSALWQAIALAPYEPGVQLKVLLVGFSLWDDLPSKLRAEVQATAKRAVEIDNDVNMIIRTAVQTGRESVLASVLSEARHLEALEKVLSRAPR